MSVMAFVLNIFLSLSYFLAMKIESIIVFIARNCTVFSMWFIWPQEGIQPVQNHITGSWCMHSGICLEDTDTSSIRRNSTTAMTSPLFQTQPPELDACRRNVFSSSRETTASDSRAAGKVSASSSATTNVSSRNDQQAVFGGRRPAKLRSENRQRRPQKQKMSDKDFLQRNIEVCWYHNHMCCASNSLNFNNI